MFGTTPFLRPTAWADPRDPTNVSQQLIPVGDLDGLDGFQEWLGQLVDGVISTEPTRVEISGRDAVYSEAEIAADFLCDRATAQRSS